MSNTPTRSTSTRKTSIIFASALAVASLAASTTATAAPFDGITPDRTVNESTNWADLAAQFFGFGTASDDDAADAPEGTPVSDDGDTDTVAATNVDDYSSDEAYAQFYGQTIEWSAEACEETVPTTGEGARECAKVIAPKNWHDPSMGTIEVGIGRIAGTDAESSDKRLLFSNPGGPGGSGIGFGTVVGSRLGTDDTHYSVGIDPRGVGTSTNLICPEPAEPSPGSSFADGDSRTFDYTSIMVDNADAEANLKACVDANEGWVEYVNTEQTARDFNLVRHVLGYDTADMYGVSYGTWLGSIMERLFPNNFDRVILDGNLNWDSGSIQQSWDLQGESFQQAADQQMYAFFARHNDIYNLGSTVREVDQAIGELREKVGAGALGDDITHDDFDLNIAYGLYTIAGFDQVGRHISAIQSYIDNGYGDLDKLREPFASEPWGASDSVFQTLVCADTKNNNNAMYHFDKNLRMAQHMPLLGTAFIHNPCAGWEHEPAIDASVFNRPLTEVLMVQNEGDPATGYYGAVEARTYAEGNVTMLTMDDRPGHGLPFLDNQCAYDVINGYLVGGEFPTKDVTCQEAPLKSGEVADTYAYELGYAGSAPDVAPQPKMYVFRNYRDPQVDQSAPVRETTPEMAAHAAAVTGDTAAGVDAKLRAAVKWAPVGISPAYRNR